MCFALASNMLLHKSIITSLKGGKIDTAHMHVCKMVTRGFDVDVTPHVRLSKPPERQVVLGDMQLLAALPQAGLVYQLSISSGGRFFLLKQSFQTDVFNLCVFQ